MANLGTASGPRAAPTICRQNPQVSLVGPVDGVEVGVRAAVLVTFAAGAPRLEQGTHVRVIQLEVDIADDKIRQARPSEYNVMRPTGQIGNRTGRPVWCPGHVGCSAYVADGRRPSNTAIVTGREPLEWHTAFGKHIQKDTAVLSAGSAKVAFKVHDGIRRPGKQYVIVNGEPQTIHYEVGRLMFVPGCCAVAYAMCEEGGLWFVVRGGVEEEDGYRAMRLLTLSSDGQHGAYAGKKRGKRHMVHAGEMAPPYDETVEARFSPNGRHLAYPAKKGRRWHVVLDGAEGQGYKSIGLTMTFPDLLKHGGTRCLRSLKPRIASFAGSG